MIRTLQTKSNLGSLADIDHPTHSLFFMSRDFVNLNHETPIASGNNRDVFRHPDDSELLIKTIKPEVIEKREGDQSSWTKSRFRRYRFYTNYLRECQEHVVARLDDGGIPPFMQQVCGFIDTDRGLGLVTRAERDASGDYAKTLQHLINENCYDEQIKQALHRFIEQFLASRVIVTDLSIKNLVYSFRDPLQPHFVLIDGYGEKNLIPFNSLSAWCHLRSKRKRVARLHLAIARAIARSREQQQSS
jgi:hypothetical protein